MDNFWVCPWICEEGENLSGYEWINSVFDRTDTHILHNIIRPHHESLYCITLFSFCEWNDRK